MKYTYLLQNIKEPIFSLQDLRMLQQKIIPSQLSDLVKKGHLVRLKNGIYVISSEKNNLIPEHTAFRLYQPSYVSMEWALSYHGIIPEVVYNVTSITSKTTRTFKNPLGSFIYRNIKSELFWGYVKEEKNGQSYLIAEPEKAILDYLYLNLQYIKNNDDIEELRFNPFTLQSLNLDKLNSYTRLFNNERLANIIKCLPFNK